MAPTPYAAVLPRNIRAARSRLGVGQDSVAARMQALGFEAWIRQTVSNTERGRRRPTAEEILGLALVLQTTIAALMSASEQDEEILLPGGIVVGAVTVERLAGRGVNDRSILWDDADHPVVAVRGRLPGVDPFDRELLAQPDFAEAPDRWHPGLAREES